MKKILLIVNPNSGGGTGKAKKALSNVVAPMLNLAQVPFEVIETQHKLHALEIGKTSEITNFRAIVTIGGDGVFHELINGILTRPDWEEAIKIPVGSIVGGRANAIAKNLDALFPELATLAVIKGEQRPMDIFSVTQENKVTYSHLQLMWAYLSDIVKDCESGYNKWMGAQIVTYYGVKRLYGKALYPGKLWMLPAEGADISKLGLANDKPTSLASFGNLDNKISGPPRVCSADPTAYLNWPVAFEDDISFFCASNQPWIASNVLTAPDTKIADGAIDVTWAGNVPMSSFTSIALKLADGGFRDAGGVNSLKCKAFVIEPTKPDPSEEKGFCVSGEWVPYAPVHVEVHPSLMNVLAPSWLDESEWKKVYNHTL